MKIYAVDRTTVVKDYFDLSILDNLKAGLDFEFDCSRYGYYVVQLLVLPSYSAKSIKISTDVLVGNDKEIDKAVTCFNTQGTDANGHKFERSISLNEGELKPIFIGLDFSKAEIGSYHTYVTIGDKKVKLTFNLNDSLVFNEGYDKGTTLARLNWLNSTAHINKKIVKAYEAIVIERNTLSFTGKKASFGNDGLIENVESYFGESNFLEEGVTKQLFSRPIDLEIDGQKVKYNKIKIVPRANTALITADGRSEKLKVDVTAKALYEGALNYHIKLTAEKDVIIPDVRLNMYFASATYLVGLGKEGGKLNENVNFKWDQNRASDVVFIGDINCGAVVRFKDGENYEVPVYNLFAHTPTTVPVESWDNYGKGGINVTCTEEGATLTAYTGKKIISAGKSIDLYFDVHLTPFRPVNLKEVFANRMGYDGVELTYANILNRAKMDKVGYVCLKNAGELNQFVNYPFDKVEELKTLALEAHKRGLGLGISYGLRDLSTKARETFVYKALGDEIILRTDNHADTDKVLVEYLGEGATESQKLTYHVNQILDAKDMSYYTVPHSRMDNFFVEGVDYLVHYADIDAISMENPAISRKTAERIAKSVTSKRGGKGIVELKVNSRNNDKNGYANTLYSYVDVIPFANKLYMSKGFDLSRDPDYVLTEVSGLIFGMTADSHYDAGVSRSLVYGMMPKFGEDEAISRALGDINKIFNDFGIENATMKGFWDKTNPVKVDNAKVYCTSYLNGGDMIAVFYNANDKTTTFEVGVENKFNFTTLGKKVYAPQIEGMQSEKKVSFGKPMKLKAHSGLIVYVKKRRKSK